MGPLSAIAIAFVFVMIGLSWVAAITASAHVLGVICIVAAIVVLLDCFWLYGRHYARRD